MKFDFSQIRNNQYFSGIMGAIIGLIVIGGIIYMIKWAKNKAKNEPFLIKKPRRGDRIEKKDKNGNIVVQSPYQYFDNKVIKNSELGSDYSYSVWIKVDDWDYNYGKPKHIFHKGDREGFSVNPGVWFYPKDNNLMIRVDTFNRKNNVNKTISGRDCQHWTSQYPHKHDISHHKYPEDDIGDHNYCRNPGKSKSTAWCYTSDPKKEWESCGFKDHNQAPSMSPFENLKTFNTKTPCDLVNIPVQRWVHLCLVMHNRTLDVFLNGKLARSCTLDGVPKPNKGRLHITDRGGFKGEIGEFKYVSRSLSPSEVYYLYRIGHKSFTFYDKLARVEPPKVDLKLQASVSVGDSSLEGGMELDTY